MAKDRSLGWIVLTAVLVAPVVVYHYVPAANEAAGNAPVIRTSLLKPKDKFPAARTDDAKISPAPEAPPPAPEPTPAVEPKAPVEAAPQEPEPQEPLLSRDPTLSPSDVMHLAALSQPSAGVVDHVPWAPPRPPKVKLEDTLNVEAIISVEHRQPEAIVNGESVGIGASINKATVLKINEDSVTFGHNGRTFTKSIEQ